MRLSSLNVTVNLGQLRKALDYEERWDGHCAKSYKEEITHLHEKICDLENTVKSINHELANRDEECCHLRQELARAPKPYTLTDNEVKTLQALRKIETKLGEGMQVILCRAHAKIFRDAYNSISSKGGI